VTSNPLPALQGFSREVSASLSLTKASLFDHDHVRLQSSPTHRLCHAPGPPCQLGTFPLAVGNSEHILVRFQDFLQNTLTYVVSNIGSFSQRALTTVLARQGASVTVASSKLNSVQPQIRTFLGGGSKQPAITDAEVTGLFSLWNDALATLDPETVAKRYASKCVLLPTVSDTPRTDYAGLVDYFTDFLQKKPQGVILESNPFIGDDYCMDAGIYEFTMGATGDKVKARYTYVYTHENGEWKIAHHHSSVMPEAFLG